MNTLQREYRVNYENGQFIETLSDNKSELSMLVVEWVNTDGQIFRDIVTKETHDLLGRSLSITIKPQILIESKWINYDKTILKTANDSVYVDETTGQIVEKSVAVTVDNTQIDNNFLRSANSSVTLNDGYITEFDFMVRMYGDIGSSHYDLHKSLIYRLREITV